MTLKRCKKTAKWHLLNFEKPTLAFCKLSKELKTNDKLTQIKKTNPDGSETEYQNNVERNNDITKFYKNIYTKIPNKTLTLSEFLTNDILQSPTIQNMKLTDEESTKDDMPITLKELTDALNTTTCNTSPGTDGYTYSVLKYI